MVRFSRLFREGPNANDGVVAGSDEALVIQREIESTHDVPTRGSHSEIFHVGLERLHDAGLVCGRDARASVIERQRANGSIVRLEDRLKVIRQPILGCGLSARETGRDLATFWRPLGATSS
jgi:hypothetical protein